jgi:hypothetical protein
MNMHMTAAEKSKLANLSNSGRVENYTNLEGVLPSVSSVSGEVFRIGQLAFVDFSCRLTAPVLYESGSTYLLRFIDTSREFVPFRSAFFTGLMTPVPEIGQGTMANSQLWSFGITSNGGTAFIYTVRPIPASLFTTATLLLEGSATYLCWG